MKCTYINRLSKISNFAAPAPNAGLPNEFGQYDESAVMALK